MPSKRSLTGSGSQRNRGGGGRVCGFPIPVMALLFFAVLAPAAFLTGRGLHSINSEQKDISTGKQIVDWRERLAMQHLKSLFSKEVIDTITANTGDLGPWSLDMIRKNPLSSSWKVSGSELSDQYNLTVDEQKKMDLDTEKKVLQSKKDKFNLDGDQSQFVDTPEKQVRRQLREKRREIRATQLVQQDDEAVVKLENAAIEKSKAVDSEFLGKYSVWRRNNENENSDSQVHLMRDQMIMARVYSNIAKMKNNTDLYKELLVRLKESQRTLGDTSTDADLHRSAAEKVKAMGQVLEKARKELYDCKLVTRKLRAMLQSADEQVRGLKKQSTFLSQLAAKTIPNGIHCLAMRLTIGYYLLPPEQRKFPRSENLENPNLYHYALFSDNVLAASVVVNSTVLNAKVM